MVWGGGGVRGRAISRRDSREGGGKRRAFIGSTLGLRLLTTPPSLARPRLVLRGAGRYVAEVLFRCLPRSFLSVT